MSPTGLRQVWYHTSTGGFSSIAIDGLGKSWHFVAAVKQGSNITVYYISYSIGDLTFQQRSDAGNFSDDSHEFYLGSHMGSLNFYGGVIDEIRIYNRTLTASEVREHYYGIYKNETGLALHLNFDGDCRDSSGQENHGTNNGASWMDGLANVNVKVELGGTLKQMVAIINSTDGSFVIPNVVAESADGQYTYNLYTTTAHGNSVQNKTINVLVERPKWYEPVVKWLVSIHPLIWIVVSAIIILTILLSLRIIQIELEKPTEITKEIQKQVDINCFREEKTWWRLENEDL